MLNKGFFAFFRIGIALLCCILSFAFPLSLYKSYAYDFNTTVASVDYLVLANPVLSKAVMPLVLYRRSQGLNVEIVNPEDIIRNYPGTFSADRIRAYLESRYAVWNLKYLLIVGSEALVPYKDLYPSFQRKESQSEPGKTWSDIYYSDLASDYDSDRNGFSGEYLKDHEINLRPQVLVGRIPFDYAADVSKMVGNILDFERSTKLRTALLSSSILSYQQEEMLDGKRAKVKTDGATLTDALYRDLLVSSGYKIHRIYEKSGVSPSLYSADFSLRKLNFENLLTTNSYDLVVWNGHGTFEALETKIWQSDTNRNNRPDKAEIIQTQVLNLASFRLPMKSKGVFVTGSCSPLTPGQDNLGKAAIKAGFSAFIGGTSINWYAEGWRNINDGGNQTLMYMIVRNLLLRNQTLGESLYHAIEESATEYMTFGAKDFQNFYSFNLYGDPAMGLISKSSIPDFSVTVDQTFKTINLGDALEFDFAIQSNGGSNFSVKAVPINYRNDLFTVFFFPDNVQTKGTIKMRMVMANNLFPSNYSITVQFLSPGKTIYRVLNFLVLPWENSPQIYINQPQTHVRRNADFSLDVDIRKAQNVDAVYIELAYNEALLSLNNRNILLGPYLSMDGVIPKVNISIISAGVIGISCSRLKFQRGVSGEGHLLSVPFRAIREGNSNITIQRALLFDPTGHPIPSKSFDAKVQISSNGLFIDRNLISGQTVPRAVTTLSGTTNAERISLSSLGKEFYLELDDKGRYQTDVSLTGYDTPLLLVAQKGNSQLVRLRTNVLSSSMISIQLKIGESIAYVNGKSMTMDAPSFINQGRTMVPIRFISESFGAQVLWNDRDQSVTISQKDIRLTLWIGKTQAVVEKKGIRKNITLDAAPRIVQNRTFVPLRFVAEGFEARIKWNPLYQLINIEYIKG
jgi:hypothetical protein